MGGIIRVLFPSPETRAHAWLTWRDAPGLAELENLAAEEGSGEPRHGGSGLDEDPQGAG